MTFAMMRLTSGGGIELAFAFATFRSKMLHQVLVGIAQNIVVIGAILGKIQLRILEDAHQVRESVHHRLTFTEFVRIVKIGEVAAGQAGIVVNQRLNDLGVDLVTDIALALKLDHVLEAGPWWYGNRWCKIIGISVFVGDVLNE